MTEYFTTCNSEDAESLRQFLKNEKAHTIIETINNNIELNTYANNEWKYYDDISGTGSDVIVHSRK